jgi:nucleoside-diphosphate-sugar epimerase
MSRFALVTGGAGFIGGLVVEPHHTHEVDVLGTLPPRVGEEGLQRKIAYFASGDFVSGRFGKEVGNP